MTLVSGYKHLMGSVVQVRRCAATRVGVDALLRRIRNATDRFIGPGLAGLGNGIGIESGSQVTEEPLFRMLGLVQQDPLTGTNSAHLARTGDAICGAGKDPRQRRDGWAQGRRWEAAVFKVKTDECIAEAKIACAVAGFDLTFSAPEECQRGMSADRRGHAGRVLCAHKQALAYVLRYAEQCLFTFSSARTAWSRRGSVGS